jgi:hypothetical protein
MKKRLHETDVANELRGASLFFQKSPADAEEAPAVKPRRRAANPEKSPPTDAAVAEPVAAPDETSPMALPAEIMAPAATAPPDADESQRVEGIRKAVKQLGKEATFCRFTLEEKNVVGDIVYTYKRNGIRTSENEIIRIAVNWLLEDYRTDGPNSVLAQVLDKLNT